MRITEIEVRNLFGLFNHRIEMRAANPVTIIHGPNGFGKTVLLSMVHGFISRQMEVFDRVPFESFRLAFDTGAALTLKKTTAQVDVAAEQQSLTWEQSALPQHPLKQKRGRRDVTIEIELTEADGTSKALTAPPNKSLSRIHLANIYRELDQAVPHPYTLRGDRWLDSSTGRIHTLDEMMSLFSVLRKHPLARQLLLHQEPEALTAIREQLSSYFIHTQRLQEQVTPSPARYDYEMDQIPEPQLMVQKYSAELAQLIETALADYGKHSQQLDRSFPARLVEFLRQRDQTLPGGQMLEQLRKLDDRRNNLTRIGFLEPENSLGLLGEEDVKRAPEALTIYVQDVAQKLSVFDELERKITLFMDIINDRFLYKRISVSRKDGFVIIAKSRVGGDGQQVLLKDLSSGEQHELVVLFELLFNVPRGALILIDEPEISLHAAWQSRFLDDLIAVLNVTQGTALVATHSAVVIGERWDLTQRLEGPEAP